MAGLWRQLMGMQVRDVDGVHFVFQVMVFILYFNFSMKWMSIGF